MATVRTARAAPRRRCRGEVIISQTPRNPSPVVTQPADAASSPSHAIQQVTVPARQASRLNTRSTRSGAVPWASAMTRLAAARSAASRARRTSNGPGAAPRVGREPHRRLGLERLEAGLAQDVVRLGLHSRRRRDNGRRTHLVDHGDERPRVRRRGTGQERADVEVQVGLTGEQRERPVTRPPREPGPPYSAKPWRPYTLHMRFASSRGSWVMRPRPAGARWTTRNRSSTTSVSSVSVERRVAELRPQVVDVAVPVLLVGDPELGGVRISLALVDRVPVVHVGESGDARGLRLHDGDRHVRRVQEQRQVAGLGDHLAVQLVLDEQPRGRRLRPCESERGQLVADRAGKREAPAGQRGERLVHVGHPTGAVHPVRLTRVSRPRRPATPGARCARGTPR